MLTILKELEYGSSKNSAGGGPLPLIAAGSRMSFIGNSYLANSNMRRYFDWALMSSGACFYPPADAGNLGLAGDRYLFQATTVPGYLSRVPNAMAGKPAALYIGNSMNDMGANLTGAQIITAFDTLLAGVQAHANYPYLQRIFIETCPQRWQLTTAQNTARTISNAYLRSLATNPFYVILDLDLSSNLNFGDYGDNTHNNAHGAFKNGTYEGTVIASQFAGSSFPATGTPTASIAISGISLANKYVTITTSTAHNMPVGTTVPIGMPTHISAFTSTFSPGFGNANYIGIATGTNTLYLRGLLSSGITGAYTSGGTINTGIAATWSTTNTTGATGVLSQTDTFGGHTWNTYTVSGTATSASNMGMTFASLSPREIGTVNDAAFKYRITNGAGTGNPVGIQALDNVVGAAVSFGVVDAWFLNVVSATNSEVITFDIYNANTVAPDNPVASMLTDWPGPTPPAYDISQYRISHITTTLPSTGVTTSTAATAIAALINADANLIAAGITAGTPVGSQVPLKQTIETGTIFFNSGSQNITVSSHVPDFDQMVTEFDGRIESARATTRSASSSFNFYAVPKIGSTLDFKIWVRDVLYLEEETVDYATPYDQVYTAINIAPNCTLSTDTATAQVGPWTGGNLAFTFEFFNNVTATNPTGVNVPAANTAPDPTQWVTTSVVNTTGINNFSGAGLTGNYLICKVTATNIYGSAYQWTTKTSGTLP